VTARRRDPYAILGVPRNASRDEVGRAYRARAKRSHPDVSGQPSTQMQDLNWAWNLLSDPLRRTAWDREHDMRTTAGHWTAPEPWVPGGPPDWRGGYANPAWTASGEPWSGAGAPAMEQRAGIGCLGVALLVLMVSALVLLGGFLSGYQSPGGEPAEASEPASRN
jgi:curved DNA-binding protein CbpA